MYPCFLCGIFLQAKKEWWQKNNIHLLLFSSIVFISLLLFWDKSFWEYTPINLKGILLENRPYSLIYLYRELYRIIIGIAGSFSFIFLFYLLFRKGKKNLFNWGKYTLEVYILQSVILELVLAKFITLDNSSFVIFNFILTPALSICILAFCIFIGENINRYSLLRFYLFGKP